MLGARWQYGLWALVPLFLLLSLLPLPAYKVADSAVSRFQVSVSKLNAEISENLYAMNGLMLAWLAGVFAISVVLLLQQRQIKAQLAAAKTSGHIDLPPLRSKQSAGQHGPYVTGLWRPHLLLPNDFAPAF